MYSRKRTSIDRSAGRLSRSRGGGRTLERQNARLRQAVSDLRLDKLILQAAARGTYGTLRAEFALSITSVG